MQSVWFRRESRNSRNAAALAEISGFVQLVWSGTGSGQDFLPYYRKDIISGTVWTGMALAGIELRYLVNQISQRVQGYYVSNIYGITHDSMLFKLHHTEKDDIFMMISGFGIWLTTVKIDQIEPNRLQRRLRSDLLRLRLERIDQIGAERVAYLTFSGFDKKFVLVGEFFGDGNIILCNDEMKILALQHSIDVRHRKLGVGLKYAPPPGNGPDLFDITESDFAGLLGSELAAAKWFGRTFGLPKKYVEGIFHVAGIDPKGVGNQLAGQDAEKLRSTARGIIADVVSGVHEPVIVRGEKTDVIPVRLGDNAGTPIDSFIAGLDTVFTENLVERGKSIRTGGTTKRIGDLQSQLSEQEKAVSAVREKSDNITAVANSLYQMVAIGITSVEDERAAEILSQNNASLEREKGAMVMAVDGEKIRINPQAPLQSVASVLFNEAKRNSGAISSIREIMETTRKKLDSAKGNMSDDSVMVSEIRKKAWYERYRWFFTTDGMLAVGGRDAASNSAVIRKQLGKNDRVFHGEIFGSPFFILKNGQDAPISSINEVAHATACFSRAWREGMHGISAYWVNPEQVKRSAPTGQFLPKGSFTIEGQRNFVRAGSLKLAVGIIKRDEDYILTCGPPEAIRKGSIRYAIIEPHGTEMADAAKKIRIEFLKHEEAITKKIGIDDFVRALPAGKSQIKEVVTGDAI